MNLKLIIKKISPQPCHSDYLESVHAPNDVAYIFAVKDYVWYLQCKCVTNLSANFKSAIS
jgi:hypothetical protein